MKNHIHYYTQSYIRSPLSLFIIRVLPNLTSIAKFVVRVFALTFREGFLSARALTKYKLYCTIHICQGWV